jgi:hypothetical protein
METMVGQSLLSGINSTEASGTRLTELFHEKGEKIWFNGLL